MDIGEVIEALERIAEQLPEGRRSEVRVHICPGQTGEAGVLTPSIEVDMMQSIDIRTNKVEESFAIVQGHPHKDPDGGRSRPVTSDVESVVEQWAADFAEHGRSAAEIKLELVTDPATGVRYLLIPADGGGRVRFELDGDGGIRYTPGAPEAVAAGCLCNPAKNNGGAGRLRDDTRAFIFRKDCPVHVQIGPGEDPLPT